MSDVNFDEPLTMMDGITVTDSKSNPIEGKAVKVYGNVSETHPEATAYFYVDLKGCIGGVQVVKNADQQGVITENKTDVDFSKPLFTMDGQPVSYYKENFRGMDLNRIDAPLNETDKMLVSFYVDNYGCMGGVQVVKN